MTKSKIILSAAQPSGNLHIGNYIGSIQNWVKLQDRNNINLFSIMDLHSLTTSNNPSILQNDILNNLAIYIASGLDPEYSILFKQSDNLYHANLAWILSNITSVSILSRMTQFKTKSDKLNKENVNLGLFSYPVLMAADILLYKADLIPIGIDQKQHLELTRNLASIFNQKYKVNFFHKPDILINKEINKIMSLTNGANKMSKSDIKENSRINIIDEDEIIVKKISKAKTDNLSYLSYEENRPEIKNLINIYLSFINNLDESNLTYKDIVNKYSSFKDFKYDLANIIINKLKPIREKYKLLIKDRYYLYKILLEGKNKSNEIAKRNYDEIRKIIGIY